MTRQTAALLLFAAAVGCAPTSPVANPKTVVDMNEPRRVVGTEADVRVDAEVYGEKITPGAPISIRYQVTNQRAVAILVADLIPETMYDDETGIVTIAIGTEIPGEAFLPRLIAIQPGERKSFTANARLNTLFTGTRTPLSVRPQALRVKVNFLGSAKAFEPLVNIPEKAVHDPKLASAIFTQWVEGNETVITNAIPMRYGSDPAADAGLPIGPPPARRGRGTGSLPITPP
jgi:hypothetical protein